VAADGALDALASVRDVIGPYADVCGCRMLLCMRTTLNLDDDLMRRAKAAALRSGCTLTSLVEDALREALSRHSRPAGEAHRIKPYAGRGLAPGVDLDDSAALLDLMEGRDGR
jgi:hypothetical protein